MNTGLGSTLKGLLSDEDALVRERAAKVLSNMTREITSQFIPLI